MTGDHFGFKLPLKVCNIRQGRIGDMLQVSFHMQSSNDPTKRKQNQPASLNQINPEMLKKGCALLRHPLLRQKWLKPLVRISKANALQALLQPFESGLECKSASRVCQVSAATL